MTNVGRWRWIAAATVTLGLAAAARGAVPDAGTVAGKVMAGYQGWFRCPGDPAGGGWGHWSRDGRRIAPDTLTFEMWPEMAGYSRRYPAPGFTHPDGSQATLFSSEDYSTVLTHFRWMRDADIDGAWLQHFLVDLPGGPIAQGYPSRMRVLANVRAAARATGRVWALAYDIAQMPAERVFDVLTEDWKRTVAKGIPADGRYLHERGLPVVLIWGFYRGSSHDPMTPEVAERLIDFFHAEGATRAYLIGGGDWGWSRHADPAWQRFIRRFDAYCPWNIGNYTLDERGVKHASQQTWESDRADLARAGVRWIPTLYPGFSWDNLTQKPPSASIIERRGGVFLWEQFVRLARMRIDTVYLAMFDEVDEGTALFRVTSSPPGQAHFVGYEGLPADWYLRLVRAGAAMLRHRAPITDAIPVSPAKEDASRSKK